MGEEGEIVKKIVNAYETIPKGYGIAYRRMDMEIAIAYPIPINLIIGGLRKLWIWCMWGHKLYEDGYTRGYSKGKNEGRKYAFNRYKYMVIKQEVETIIRNTLSAECEMIKIYRKDKSKVDGWIYRLIDNEIKRIERK